jgi:hypothetical protein
MGYGLDGWGSIPGRGKKFVPCSVQTRSGVLQASYPKDTRALSPEVKQLGSEADNSLESSPEVKNGGAIRPPLEHRDSYYYYYYYYYLWGGTESLICSSP